MLNKSVFSRGQSAVESMILLAVALFVLTYFVYLIFDQMESSYLVQQSKEGFLALDLLDKEISDVYFLGPGTVREVLIFIPDSVDLENSFIGDNYLLLRVNGNDLVVSTDVNIVGVWPNANGSTVFVITAFDDFVSLSAQPILFSPAKIERVINQNSSEDVNVVVDNVSSGDVSYGVVVSLSGGASITYSGASPFSISAGEEETLSFSVSCDKESFGAYSGYVVFYPVSGSDANLSLPVRVVCSSAQSKLSVLPSEKIFLASLGVDSSDSLLVCNNSQSDFSSSSALVSGEASKYVFTSFSGIISANSCRLMSISIKPPLIAGDYLGEVSVYAGGFTAVSDINLSVS